MRVAIIGSGISGLVAGWKLHRVHDVTLFEADDRIGGHTNTVHVAVAGGRARRVAAGAPGAIPVDTGFIVHNPVNYPVLCRIFAELGVATQDSEMSFAVSCARTGVEWAGHDLDSVFVQRRNLLSPGFWSMLRGMVRFNRRALDLIPAKASPTLGEFLARERIPARAVEHYIMPIGAAIWSAPPSAMRSFPARDFASFLFNHGMLQVGDDRPQWRTVVGGSNAYLPKITAGWRERIRLSAPVARVARVAGGVEVQVRHQPAERFDRVVFACHSDQALAMLAAPADRERQVLAALPYQANPAALHTDIDWLPRRRKAWSAWNFRSGLKDAAVVTYWMNRLQRLAEPTPLLVSLNADIADGHAAYRTTYHHPRFTAGSTEAKAQRPWISGADRIHYCGAYWGHGFHEDGAASGMAVAEELGA